jgi:hypothetical protein
VKWKLKRGGAPDLGGLANVKTGQRDLGSAYLQQAIDLGAKQGYLLRKREAERERDALGLASRRSA